MITLCKIHIHDWVSRQATLRSDRLIRKCRRCGKVKVVRMDSQRRQDQQPVTHRHA